MKAKINLSRFIYLISFVLIFLFITYSIKVNGEVETMIITNQEINLPKPKFSGTTSLEESLYKRRSIRNYKNEPLTLQEVSQLLWSMQGITDEGWGLRTSPSAGALYPLEIYIVVGNVINLESGIYKYSPQNHSLKKILNGDKRKEIFNAALQQESIIQAPANIVITAVFQRTAKKYGSRAERYVWLEAGHAAQNLLLQVTALGLGAVPIGAFYDEKVKVVLGLQKDEEPLYIIPVGKK